MRPLGHLGISGPHTPDYKLYTLNEELYDALSERGENILESAKKDFMGKYYNPPLPTLDELQKKLDEQISRSERLVVLKAPKEILQGENRITMRVYKEIENKNYGSLNDPVYKAYLEAYCKKEWEWNTSKEKEKLLGEIYAYNEAEYTKIKLEEESSQ